ncbi:MAG: radical SAM protein [Deferribacteraceae bacterium]|jgi:hypothetical protein|nr:radical SAM protein [Deferribacteraceae bacterium]
MIEHTLILISTSGEQERLHDASGTLSIASLLFWLNEAGIDDAAFFPEDDAEITIAGMENRFEYFLDNNAAKIFGISVWSNSFTIAKKYAETIRRRYPDSIIIGGGAHFNSRDNIDIVLNSKTFDMVCYGGADPFFQLMTDIKSKKIKLLKKDGGLKIDGKMPETGLYYLGGPILRAGQFDKAAIPVIYRLENCFEISALFSDFCSNGCDYCTVHKRKNTLNSRLDTEDMVLQAYDYLKTVSDETVNISILDSSPFLDKNRKNTVRTLKKLSYYAKDVTFTVFADPTDFDEEFKKIVKEYKVRTIFLGRDRVNEDLFTGRKFNGKLRKKHELASEQKMVADFIYDMNSEKQSMELFIGYIASPFDTKNDASALIDEINLFKNKAGGGLVVQPNIFLLNPYRGTNVWKRSVEIAWDVHEFAFPYPNVWHGSKTNMVWLELLRLVVSPMFSAGCAFEASLAMLKFAKNLAFGGDEETGLSGQTDIMRDVAEQAVKKIILMNLGSEKSIDEWFMHLEEIYLTGLLLVSAAVNSGTIKKHGAEKIMQYIKDNNIMIAPLKEDFKLIKNKKLKGTWYERFL